MAGRGPAPKAQRRNPADVPARGEWQPTDASWRFGAVPQPPEGLMPASQEAWRVWFGAWWAAHWSPDDLPAIRQIVRLYDQVERGEFHRASELRLQMDTYGITPKGQQDRRWAPPKAEPVAPPAESGSESSRYGHLKAV